MPLGKPLGSVAAATAQAMQATPMTTAVRPAGGSTA